MRGFLLWKNYTEPSKIRSKTPAARSLYNEICDEIENREPGAYVFFSKKTDDTFFEYRLQIFEDNFNLSSIDIHIADKNYHVDFD